MNNETKDAIDILKNVHGDILIEDAIRLAITALERLDKVKFVTKKEIATITDNPSLDCDTCTKRVIELLESKGLIIEEEKRFRWEGRMYKESIHTFMLQEKLTRQEMIDSNFDMSLWHPVKEEE
jgi:hypothetical protein